MPDELNVKEFLQAKGFAIYDGDQAHYGVDWYAGRGVPGFVDFLPVPVPLRDFDRKLPVVIIQPWKMEQSRAASFTMSIRGDILLTSWVSFEHYGLDADFLMQHLEKREEALVRAWTAAASTRT
jgi:hypothetical protein